MDARYTIRKHQLLDECQIAPEIFEQVIPRLYTFTAIPGERQSSITTALSRLPFRKHQCENTPLTGTI